MRLAPSFPSLCMLLVAAALAPASTGAAPPPSPLVQRLLAALDASERSQAVLEIVARTRHFREGQEYSRADVRALLPLDGREGLAVLAHTPFTRVSTAGNSESNERTTFNGRYWATATYDLGNAGDLPTAMKKLRISREADPAFNSYRHQTGLELCLPFVRFQDAKGWVSLRQLLEGKTDGWAWSATEEKQGDKTLIRLSLGAAEWLLIDPDRNFVVLEHIQRQKNWQQEARALKVRKTTCGLWFVTDYVFTDTIAGRESQRWETQVTDVTFARAEDLADELKPRYGRGWQVKDERTHEEYLIQEDAGAIFQKIDAVPK